MSLDSYIFSRVSKKTTKDIDIIELVYGYEFVDNKLVLKVSTGSVENLKPETVLEAFYKWISKTFDEFDFLIQRTEVYGVKDEKFIPLEDFGEDIE